MKPSRPVLPFIELPDFKSKMTGVAFAHAVIARAKRTGFLPAENDCAFCSRRVKGRALHHHHESYDYPLRVTPLCDGCHKARHRCGRLRAPTSPIRRGKKTIHIVLTEAEYDALAKRARADQRRPNNMLWWEWKTRTAPKELNPKFK